MMLGMQQKKNILNSNGISRRRKKDSESNDVCITSPLEKDVKTCDRVTEKDSCRNGKLEITESHCPAESTKASFTVKDCFKQSCSASDATPGMFNPNPLVLV